MYSLFQVNSFIDEILKKRQGLLVAFFYIFDLMRTAPLLFLLFLTFLSKAQTVDYNEYHKLINEAEVHYFINNNIDSALFYYDIAFSAYDKVFARDCMIAIQIAVKHKKNADAYIIKGFRNGITEHHILSIPFLRDNIRVKELTKLLFVYSRKKYLKRINVDYLDWLMNFAIQDQCMKVKDNDIYYKWLLVKYDSLKLKIKDWGFPGDFNIGLGQADIFKELGVNRKSLNERLDTVLCRDLSYFKNNKYDETLCAPFINVLIYHYACGYMYFEKEIKRAIKNGNLHPRDAAAMHDFMFYLHSQGFKYCAKYGRFYLNEFYGVSVYGMEEATKRGRASKSVMNLSRKKIGVNVVDVDIAKRKNEKEFGMKLFYGYSGCR